MAEETSGVMNLDLNLGPIPEPGSGSVPVEAVNLEDWIGEPLRGHREAARLRGWPRWRWRHAAQEHNISMEFSELIDNSVDGTSLQAGEGSVTAEERASDVPKVCENNTNFLEDGATDKDNLSKNNGTDGGFFDCNICLELARDPVVTCCGHLFCWPCLYRWLQHHEDIKECPVCKGEVTCKNVTPIYGRGNNIHEPEEDPSLKIPVRPHARRVESLRQTIHRNVLNFPMEEMIRRLGSRYDLTRDLFNLRDSDGTRETGGRTASLIDRFLTSRRMRREQNTVVPPDDIVDLTQNETTSHESGESRRLHSRLLRRSQSRNAEISSLTTPLGSASALVEYLRSRSIGRNQEQPPPVDDRDSFSSIAAVINSESQVDTAVEIDSMVSLSTSTSRRRNDVARLSDLDSGDSRAPRRRRLN
ncbi:uncharacterized ATP-dependent helicase IRC20 [Eucalyptus grandis]|uniref:Uncharacterized protein n=2 Tax=Eucalyptus grandis TaxID=71139 RepID=A0ACC3M675_EUCGR|nr:uncharacterized ATP-dependent helicase IRC20 [Eucalyptus grandis]KAK3446835.1 hypothetical protein EUGRSUZ_A02461 [Eucalyptus grandis]